MFSIVSCANNDSTKNNSNDNEETSPSLSQSQLSESSTQVDVGATPKEIYDRLDNNTPKNQLIKTEYSLDSLQKTFARNGHPLAGYALAIKEIDEKFPIQCI
ncbi:MAG: hypothetical protein RR483_01380, partial [Clostridia bacterium]